MKSSLQQLFFAALASAFFVIPSTGCGGSGEATAVTEDADAAALAEYDRLIAESEAADDAAEGQ